VDELNDGHWKNQNTQSDNCTVKTKQKTTIPTIGIGLDRPTETLQSQEELNWDEVAFVTKI